MPLPTAAITMARRLGLARNPDITVTLPKPMTSGAKAAGRFGKQDFVYVAADDVYRCPAGERLTYRYTNERTERHCAAIGRAPAKPAR